MTGNDPAAASGGNAQRIAPLQESVRLVHEFAVRRARVDISDDLIDRIVRLTRLDPAKVTDEDEAGLWKCLNELNKLVYPSTIESIEIARSLERAQGKIPRFAAFRKDVPEAAKQIGSARFWMQVSLALVIVLQVYTLILSSIVSSVEAARGQFRAAVLERAQITQAIGAGEQSATLNAVNSKVEVAALDLQASVLSLWKITWPWRCAFTLSVDALPANVDSTPAAHAASDQISIQKAATAMLRALALYGLPLLYGLLGASAYILRRLSRQLEDATFAVTGRFRYRLRLTLGALLGATIGLFTTSEGATLSGAGIGMVALAFLAGYSVEFAFSIFDVVIDRLRKAFGVEISKPGAGDSAAADAKQLDGTDPKKNPPDA